MENRGFAISEVLKLAWTKFKEQPWVWISAQILTLLIFVSEPYVQNYVMGFPFSWNPIHVVPTNENITPMVILVWLIYAIIRSGLMLGLIYMGLRAADGVKLHIFHLFAKFHYVFHYIIGYIVYSLIVLAGFILLLFPAAIWSSKFALYPYFIIDQGAGPFHALKLSSETTKGFKWDVFAFFLIYLILILAGFFALVLGLFIVVPILNISWGAIYRKLQFRSVIEKNETPNSAQLPTLENKTS